MRWIYKHEAFSSACYLAPRDKVPLLCKTHIVTFLSNILLFGMCVGVGVVVAYLWSSTPAQGPCRMTCTSK